MENAATDWLSRAEQLRALNRPAQAAQLARERLAQEPNDPDAHLLLAQSLFDQGEIPDARQAAETAVGLAPDRAYAHFILGLAWLELSQQCLPDALACVREAIRLGPVQAQFYAIESSILYQQNQLVPALAAADAGLALDATHADCLLQRAICLAELTRDAEAQATYTQLLWVDPANPKAHNNLALLLLHQNRDAEALAHYREALRLDPDFALARVGVVEVLLRRYATYRLERRLMKWLMARLALAEVGRGYPAGRRPWQTWLLLLFFPVSSALQLPAQLQLRRDPAARPYLTAHHDRALVSQYGMLVGLGVLVAAWLVPAGRPAVGLLAALALALPLYDLGRALAAFALRSAFQLFIYPVSMLLLLALDAGIKFDSPGHLHDGYGRLLLAGMGLLSIAHAFQRTGAR
ncbi:tetratricopeptide repeat protein [Hymenobacter psoromatis]|uniref:tetratricopeptide repeat protein n=1 Tax=Hymenobacter psoromatis TaxID=1484116 RepID=UPI001CC06B08|nr:tetratricopeptide repeat protein [Hymenobacter psoromatis]